MSGPPDGARIRQTAPSIDQKVPGLGYSKTNSVIVAAAINLMKHELDLDDFRQFCGAVWRHSPHKSSGLDEPYIMKT